MTTSPDSLAGWKIKRVDQGPFKTIEIYSPNGCAASVSSHDRNPSNILYMLAEALLLAQATPSIPQAEPVSSIDAAQRKGYLGTAEEWREACRLFRARCSPEDCSAMARLRTYLEDGLLVAIRPPPPQPEGMGRLTGRMLHAHAAQTIRWSELSTLAHIAWETEASKLLADMKGAALSR